MVPRNFTYPINLLHFNPVDSNFVYAWPLRWICFLYFTYLYKINYTYIYGIFPFCTNFKYAGICFFFCSFSVALSRLLFRAYYPASCAFTHTHTLEAHGRTSVFVAQILLPDPENLWRLDQRLTLSLSWLDSCMCLYECIHSTNVRL